MKDAKGHGSNPRSGGAGGAVRLDTEGSPRRKTGYLGSAREERIAIGKATDARRADLAPPSSITDRMAAMSLGQGHPKSYISPLGSSFAAAKDQLDRARNLALPRGTPGRRKS